MRVLIIPDVHLKPWIFDLCDLIPPIHYDRIISLGDWADDWYQGQNDKLYSKTFRRLKKFLLDHPDSDFLIGNHEFSYLFNFEESGFSCRQQGKVKKLVGDIYPRKTYSFVKVIGDTIFSHAGVSKSWVSHYVLPRIQTDNILAVEMQINQFKFTHPHIMWNEYSPIWWRPEAQPDPFYGDGKYFNVFGHTPTDITLTDQYLACDTFSTFSDANRTVIGGNELVIFDTNTHAVQYVKEIIGETTYKEKVEQYTIKHMLDLQGADDLWIKIPYNN